MQIGTRVCAPRVSARQKCNCVGRSRADHVTRLLCEDFIDKGYLGFDIPIASSNYIRCRWDQLFELAAFLEWFFLVWIGRRS